MRPPGDRSRLRQSSPPIHLCFTLDAAAEIHMRAPRVFSPNLAIKNPSFPIQNTHVFIVYLELKLSVFIHTAA
jgi:hypothetical protein